MKKIFGLLILIVVCTSLTHAQTATNKIDSTGNIGIGTITPSVPLEINGTGNKLRLWKGLGNAKIDIFSGGDGSHNNSPIEISSYGYGGSSDLRFTIRNWGGSYFYQINSIDGVYNLAKISKSGGSSEGINSGAGILDLFTLNQGIGIRLHGNGNSYFNSGNVGIGTTSPAQKLHVSSGTSGDAVFKIESDTDNNNEGDNSRIEIIQDGGLHGALIGFNSDWSGTSESDNLFRVVTRRSNTNDEDAFVIKTTYSNSITRSFVGIGTINPSHELEVNGTIRSKEVIVEATGWPDYVFEENYNLPSLSEIEAFIKANKHLPEIPSAKEMEVNGITLGEMNMLLLKKIEELTLHTIQQQKELDTQKGLYEQTINLLLQRIEALEQKSE
ncbi:MAG: hypothetical protein ACMZ7B_01665 [Balneola sp.]